MTVTFVIEAMAAANAVRRHERLEILKRVRVLHHSGKIWLPSEL